MQLSHLTGNFSNEKYSDWTVGRTTDIVDTKLKINTEEFFSISCKNEEIAKSLISVLASNGINEAEFESSGTEVYIYRQ